MFVAFDGGGPVAAAQQKPVSAPPPPPPPPPPLPACRVDTVERAPQHHPSLFESLWNTASSDASSAWHTATSTLAPVGNLATGAYDFLLKSDVDGVMQHQQTAKDLLTTIVPGASIVNTAIGTAQNYFGSGSADHGNLAKAFTDSASQNNPVAAIDRLASHPGETLGTGFHMAMLASWLVPGVGEAADAGAHVAIAGGRSLLEHVGLGAVNDVVQKGAAALSEHIAAPVMKLAGDAGKKLFATDAKPLLAGASSTVEHAGTKMIHASKLAAADLDKTMQSGGRVFWSGGARAQQAATSFAEEHGLKTIGMSKLGEYAARRDTALAQQGLTWATGIRHMWELASTVFANHAEGVAHVFLRDNPGLADSIWNRIERPILEESSKIGEIIKHDVF